MINGLPDCGSTQRWSVYYYTNSSDVLHLLPNGVLRHYTHYVMPPEPLYSDGELEENSESVYYDYQPGKYCLDKVSLKYTVKFNTSIEQKIYVEIF